MDFKDQIKQLSARVEKIKDNILTEEATKDIISKTLFWAMSTSVD